MGLRNLLKKKDEVAQDGEAAAAAAAAAAAGGPSSAEFTFLRTDTTTQEVIHPPAGAESGTGTGGVAGGRESLLSPNSPVRSPPRRSLDVFRPARSRSGSTSSQASHSSPSKKRLSERLHLSRPPEASDFVPQDLPEIAASADPNDDESQWEHRATILAGQGLAQGAAGLSEARASVSSSRPRSPSPTPVSSQTIDSNVQEAIRLHEQGDYEQSTKIFGRLADPQGANNPLSQVLYGLALRHGWGCEPDLARAVDFLTAAASNSAAVEQLALQAGMKKGGAAKGELVLAIFELANCFRHGWGIKRDAVAAKQYYETAANLGDTDAMNEVAWCYEHGFGCKKDKFTAARYYRQAEKAGNKTLGNSWIWKPKYDPPASASGAEGVKKGKEK